MARQEPHSPESSRSLDRRMTLTLRHSNNLSVQKVVAVVEDGASVSQKVVVVQPRPHTNDALADPAVTPLHFALNQFGDRPLHRLAIRRARRVALLCSRDLNEVAAGVVKDRRGHGSHRDRRLSESNSRRSKPLVFRVHVLDRERCKRNPVIHECPLERPHGREKGSGVVSSEGIGCWKK